MTKIKISSDPYNSLLSYQIWDEDSGAWTDYSRLNHPSSNLFNDKYAKSFFPFKAKDILDILIHDFCGIIESETLGLVFEGTGDEYTELEQLCDEEPYKSRIQLSRSDTYLSNASDILPKIVEVFKNVADLVEKTNCEEKVQEKTRKFEEATNEMIPICVMGNYSSGKSTFINALIGSEILPSNAKPVTGRVFKISNSDDKKKAQISFEYAEQNYVVKVSKQSFSIIGGSEEKVVYQQIASVLEETRDHSLQSRVNKVLEILNGIDYDKSDGTVEVAIPFGRGVLSESKHSYVIFDTPGSNSTSNEKHKEVLNESLKGFSNGIPVIVSRLETLDADDNNKLCELIESIEGFDKRFALIVVNKADAEQLPDNGYGSDKEREILGQNLPSKLYAEGVFFVSSIMALGAKEDGKLDDKYYKEIFTEKKIKYDDPKAENYKQLYTYNIMPKQLKKRAEKASLACEDNIYANSGMYWVEQEIETFAEKYAPYNKSLQAKNFLDGVIADTKNEIIEQRKECDVKLANMKEDYEQKKEALIDSVSTKGQELIASGHNAYAGAMHEASIEASTECLVEKLEEHRAYFQAINDEKNDIAGKMQAVEDSKKAFNSRIKLFDENLKPYNELVHQLNDAKLTSNRETSLDVLGKVEKRFKDKAEAAQHLLVMRSREYWDSVAATVREGLVKLVTESNALEEEQRKELSEIIINYKDVPLYTDVEKIFENHNSFDKGLKALNIIFNKNLNELNFKKIKRTYDREMKELIDLSNSVVKDAHRESFNAWFNELYALIINNLEDYNPTLSSRRAAIGEEEDHITELEGRKEKLEEYAEQINEMLSPKSF